MTAVLNKDRGQGVWGAHWLASTGLLTSLEAQRLCTGPQSPEAPRRDLRSPQPRAWLSTDGPGDVRLPRLPVCRMR